MFILEYNIEKASFPHLKLKRCQKFNLCLSFLPKIVKSIKGQQSIKLLNGFTIVELIVVITVIGVLSTITAVSYSGIVAKAKIAAVQSELANNANILKMYSIVYGSYPTTLVANCPTAPIADNNYCLKVNSGSTLAYSSIIPSDFHLTVTNGSTSYSMNNTASPALATSVTSCPTGYIPVPGSGTYGTNDFCVMKYEAKIQGNDNGNQTYSSAFVPESRVSGTPWVNISQTNAIAEAKTACANCHLITEAEWMTIAQNVLSVASNWSSGVAGTGKIYNGHNDGVPNNALAASTDDNGYYGTGQTTGSSQRRTLILTNGAAIWDFAGNVYDWTSGTVQSPTVQPGITGSGFAWHEWKDLNNAGTLPVNPSPVATGLANASTWTTNSGIGQLYSSSIETALCGFMRGGNWTYGDTDGVLFLSLGYTPGDSSAYLGFRVASS